MSRVDLTKAKAHLEELAEQAARGEEVVITRGDGAAFKLVPAPGGSPQPCFGSAKGHVWMSDDFDEPLDDFDDYAPAA